MNCGDKKGHIGNLYGFLTDYYDSRPKEYSWLTGNWADFGQWKAMAQAKVFELLNYFPKAAPLDAAVLSRRDRGTYDEEEVEFNTCAGVRVRGTLLLPHGGGRRPALVALHDHSGFYYSGREKVVAQDCEPQALKDLKASTYSGRSWANAAAEHGYVVLAIDAFYFGSRRLDLSTVNPEVLQESYSEFLKAPAGSDAHIRLYNELAGGMEYIVVKHIFFSGTTWPGILFHDDRRSVDYLCTRAEVDRDRIGCCGLSLGGFRSAHLAALDPRIKCCVAAGWMPSYRSMLYDRLRYHTYMVYVPGLAAHMDLPDVASLAAPNPLFIQQCAWDRLFNLEGMQEACGTIAAVYGKTGMQDRFQSSFYDNGHEFNQTMQNDAFAWLGRWLQPEKAEQ